MEDLQQGLIMSWSVVIYSYCTSACCVETLQYSPGTSEHVVFKACQAVIKSNKNFESERKHKFSFEPMLTAGLKRVVHFWKKIADDLLSPSCHSLSRQILTWLFQQPKAVFILQKQIQTYFWNCFSVSCCWAWLFSYRVTTGKCYWTKFSNSVFSP